MEQINAKSIFSPATGFIAPRRLRLDVQPLCRLHVRLHLLLRHVPAAESPAASRTGASGFRPRSTPSSWPGSRRRSSPGKALYMSSVTDPYLPAERSLS